MNSLKNQVAIVTRGAGNIGLATAREFLEAGASVLLVDLKQDAVNAAVRQLESPKVKGFAAGPASASCSGTVYPVDGGFTSH